MYRRGGNKKEQSKPAKEESDSSKYAELLVFGYACKVFRDDERALYHEQAGHLIPWMGDKSVMIDRYDGRGHLHDLSEYDAGSWNHSYQLSEEEARIEALCDEERYLALHTDLLEEEARQEEEYKRLSEALADEGTYNAVAFRYSADYYDPSQPTEEEEVKDAAEDPEPQDAEEPFVAPPGLIIPPDVELPATSKTHAIIERTANFVCKQGAQFEIVLKAKQARNSQFDFLRFDHYLNPYYKHMLRTMKEGRYTPLSDSKQEVKEESMSDDSDDDDEGGYLHPSLFASKKTSHLQEIIKPLQVMDPDHPLAELVRRARQEKNGAAAMATSPAVASGDVAMGTPSQPEYGTDPNVAAMYYGYCMLPDGTYCLAPPPPGIDAAAYYSSLPGGAQPAPTPSAAPPPPGTTPPPASEPVSSAPTPVSVSAPSQASSSAPQAATATRAPAIIPPPPDVQPVIDKLAEYVARNGLKFESSVRSKNDSRFEFLLSWHQYNAYYEFKKQYFLQKEGISLQQLSSSDHQREPASAAASDPGTECDGPASEEAAGGSEDALSKEGKLIKASFAPISFAIRAKESDLLPLEKNRVRLDDDSDEDQDKEAVQEGGVEGVVAMVMKEAAPAPPPEEKKPSLTPEELEAKQAKLKLEDRLAAAAREKLAQASKEWKEKQVQAERKRKAALFLQTLRGAPSCETETRRPDAPSAPPQQPEVLSPPVAPPPIAPRVPLPIVDPGPPETAAARLWDPAPPLQPAPPSTSSSASHGHDREREKKKKKRKKRSRSRSPSRSKSKHALPSAYRRVRRSRSRSRSPGRRERAMYSVERRRDERERYVPSAYRRGNSPGFSQKRSRSRSPHENRKKSSKSQLLTAKASSCSPSSSPGGAESRKHSASLSPSNSPAASLGTSRGGSLETDRRVSSAIVSSVQAKITQDLMAKVRAMLAASKEMRTGPS